MKIFNRGEKAPAKGDAAAAAPAPAPEPAPVPVAPPAPDLTSIIDANVKEMSEKIARLATTIESEHSERGDFEAKLEKMEERMRKLSSLTEMISAQYNPFVGAAPAEREALPAPEVGLSMPPLAAPPEAAPAGPSPAPLQSAMGDMQVLAATPFGDSLFPDAPPMPAPPPAPEMPAAEAQAQGLAQADAAARLWAMPNGFSASLLVLNWADMLLKSAPSRESLADIANYYHTIGWIGEPARDQLLAYADGLKWDASSKAKDWRANVEMHEKSLLYVEKLRALVGRRGE